MKDQRPRRLIGPAGGLSVQIMLRVGYGRPVDGTPRRPPTEVLSGW
jgi:hypothetical protein